VEFHFFKITKATSSPRGICRRLLKQEVMQHFRNKNRPKTKASRGSRNILTSKITEEQLMVMTKKMVTEMMEFRGNNLQSLRRRLTSQTATTKERSRQDNT